MKLKQSPKEKARKDTSWLRPRKVERFLFFLLIFFLPTQLAFHFWPDWALVFGIRVDYLSPTIYFTDVLILLLVVVSKTKVNRLFLTSILVFAFVNTLNSISPWASFYKWLRIFELIYFASYVSINHKWFKEKKFFKILSFSLITISVIGIAQMILGSTLGGPFYLLGERSFNFSTPGIALENIFGKGFLRPYSVFSHPNSLAGFLGLSLLIFPQINWHSKALSIIAYVLSGSMGAYLATIASMIFRRFSQSILIIVLASSLLIPIVGAKVVAGEEVVERIGLMKVAGELISNNFLTGTGLNTFVYKNPLMQPVHNIFLLVLAETGIVGFILFCWMLFKGIRKYPGAIIFILVTGFFDHYWLTLQQNMVLLALVFGLVL